MRGSLTHTALLLDQYKPNEGLGFFPVFRLGIVYLCLLLAVPLPGKVYGLGLRGLALQRRNERFAFI